MSARSDREMLSFRVPRRIKERLGVRAEVEGRDRTEVATEALVRYLGPDPAAGPAEAGQVDPARWLARHTGESLARCRVLISLGRVDLAGETLTGELVDVEVLDRGPVAIDGRDVGSQERAVA